MPVINRAPPLHAAVGEAMEAARQCARESNLRGVCLWSVRINYRGTACVIVEARARSCSTKYPKYGVSMPPCAGRREDATQG